LWKRINKRLFAAAADMWTERSTLLKHKNIFKINVSMRRILNVMVLFIFYTIIAAGLLALTLLVAINDLKVAYAVEIKASTSCQIGRRFQNDTDVWFEHKTNCFEKMEFNAQDTPYQLSCNPDTGNVRIIAPMGQITPYGIFNVNLVETRFYALLVKQAKVNIVNKCDHWFESDPGFQCPDGYECHRESFENSACVNRCLFGNKMVYADYQYIIDIQEVYWYSRPSVDVHLQNIENYTITAHASVDTCANGFIISNGQIYCVNDPSNAPKWIFFSNTTFSNADVVTAIRSLFSLNNYCNELVELYREPVYSDGTSISVYAEIEGTSTIECPNSVGITSCTKGTYFYENGTFFIKFDSLCILDNSIVSAAEYQHCAGCNNDCTWSIKGNGENRTCIRGHVDDFKETIQATNEMQKKACDTISIIIFICDGFLFLQWVYVLIHVIIYMIDYCKAKEEVQMIQESHGKFIKKNYMDATPFEREVMQESLLKQIMASYNTKQSEGEIELSDTPLASTNKTKSKKIKKD
jgi:hypothetical protein